MIKKEIIFLLIPLILTSFTHLWNVNGFPLFHTDEGHYMRRALIVLNGISLEDTALIYENAYDTPFFGQILLGYLLKLSGYPNFVLAQTISSIELTIGFPRIIMGIFAIIDTFLVFKISHRTYNTSVALFASILFAVTPMTWILRHITLDAIGLPFLLTSILVSLNIVTWNKNDNFSKLIFLVLLSGTFLGIAILTKIPFFTMIPLVAYLIYKNSKHLKWSLPLKMIVIWALPVILITSIWPLYAVYVDEFDLWKRGIMDQVTRERTQILETFYNLDSILLFLGIVGFIYSIIRRDWILILWISPFLIFVYAHGWFMYFHWIMVFSAFCIAGAKFVIELVGKVKSDKIKKSTVIMIICTAIIGIGFFNTFVITNQNFESGAIRALAAGLNYSDRADGLNDGKINENITVISPPEYSWIFKYVHKMDYSFDTHKDVGLKKIDTNKTLLLQKGSIVLLFDKIEDKFSSFVLGMGKARIICNLDIKWYKPDFRTHSPLVVTPLEYNNLSNNTIFEVRNSIDKNSQRIDMKNTSASDINITLLPNSENRIGAISNIVIYGKKNLNDDCKKIPIKIIKFIDHSFNFNTLDNYETIASYQKLLIEDKKMVSKYKTDIHDVNDFTKLFAGFKFRWPPGNTTLMSNF